MKNDKSDFTSDTHTFYKTDDILIEKSYFESLRSLCWSCCIYLTSNFLIQSTVEIDLRIIDTRYVDIYPPQIPDLPLDRSAAV